MACLNRFGFATSLFAVLFAGCEHKSSAAVAVEAPAVPTFPPALVETKGRIHGQAPTEEAVSPTMLIEMGLKVTTVDDHHARACPADRRRCVCIEPMEHRSSERYLRFDAHVEHFRRELKGVDGRLVYCRSAEIGTCGEYHYFRYVDQVAGDETLWFDGFQRLVTRVEWTDYRAYCDHTTNLRIQGPLPICNEVKRTEILCGTNESPIVPETILRKLAAPQHVVTTALVPD